MLDLWAKVIKAKYVERQVKVLDTMFCVPEEYCCSNLIFYAITRAAGFLKVITITVYGFAKAA
jgi:hypothetical protein